jgi:hypothetical protein
VRYRPEFNRWWTLAWFCGSVYNWRYLWCRSVLLTDDLRIAASLNIKSLRSEKSKLGIKKVGESVRNLVKNGAKTLLKYDIASTLMCWFQNKTVPLIVHAVTRVIVSVPYNLGARGGAVGWGTALQSGRSRVRFSIISLEFFIDITLTVTLWPWGRLSF